jgi:hypothetical protein
MHAQSFTFSQKCRIIAVRHLNIVPVSSYLITAVFSSVAAFVHIQSTKFPLLFLYHKFVFLASWEGKLIKMGEI